MKYVPVSEMQVRESQLMISRAPVTPPGLRDLWDTPAAARQKCRHPLKTLNRHIPTTSTRYHPKILKKIPKLLKPSPDP